MTQRLVEILSACSFSVIQYLTYVVIRIEQDPHPTMGDLMVTIR